MDQLEPRYGPIARFDRASFVPPQPKKTWHRKAKTSRAKPCVRTAGFCPRPTVNRTSRSRWPASPHQASMSNRGRSRPFDHDARHSLRIKHFRAIWSTLRRYISIMTDTLTISQFECVSHIQLSRSGYEGGKLLDKCPRPPPWAKLGSCQFGDSPHEPPQLGRLYIQVPKQRAASIRTKTQAMRSYRGRAPPERDLIFKTATLRS